MDSAALGARVLLALLFIIAGISKLRDRNGTADAIVAFGGSRRYARPAARVLPAVELGIGVAVLARPSAVAGGASAIVLLSVFTAAILRAVLRHQAPACACFGNLWSRPVDRITVTRNLVLLALAAFIALGGPGAAISPAVGGAVVALAAGFAIWVEPRASAKRERLLAARSSDPHRESLPVGTPAPSFRLEVSGEGDGSLDALCGLGMPVLLVFLSSSCGACKDLHPHVARWQTTLAERMSIAVITSGGLEAALELSTRHATRNVLVDSTTNPVSRAYRVFNTPSGVLIAADRSIASVRVQGADAIEELVRQTIRRLPPVGEPWRQSASVV